MTHYIDQYKNRFGVEPICQQLPIAPSTYYDVKQWLPSACKLRDEKLKVEIARVHTANFGVYGARKVWRQLKRERIPVTRCIIERLMRDMGLEGVRRGKKQRTTVADEVAPRPADLVERNFAAQRPNQLWVADLTYIATWSGFVYVAFVIDAYSPLHRRLASFHDRSRAIWPSMRWRWRSGRVLTKIWEGLCITTIVKMSSPVSPRWSDPHSDRLREDMWSRSTACGLTHTLIDYMSFPGPVGHLGRPVEVPTSAAS